MALRDQPYLPLYIQDFVTDEKLMECSAAATGVYIRIMCLMHKSESYGKILLKQKYKQNTKHAINFAVQIGKFLPYDLQIIESSLDELVCEGVLTIDGEELIQKRMVKDGHLSDLRSNAGKKGGRKKESFAYDFAKAKSKAKIQANTENEYVYENDNVIDLKKGVQGEKIEKDSDPKTFIDFTTDSDQFDVICMHSHITKVRMKFIWQQYCLKSIGEEIPRTKKSHWAFFEKFAYNFADNERKDGKPKKVETKPEPKPLLEKPKFIQG